MGSKRSAVELFISPRLRVMRGKEIALGPGRVELLEWIAETGNLRAAASRMGVSYMRAWNLVRETNRCFSEPLVVASRGGKTGGGARVTEMGKRIIGAYRRMEQTSQKAILPTWIELRKSLKR